MRGPGLKTDLEVRRVWRCPACGYERRVGGQVTSVRCQCGDRPFMRLAQEPRFVRPANLAPDVYFLAEEVLADEPESQPGTGSPPPMTGEHAASPEFQTGATLPETQSLAEPTPPLRVEDALASPADEEADNEHMASIETSAQSAESSQPRREGRPGDGGKRRPNRHGRRRGPQPPPAPAS
jgi:hypothetical protein